MSKDQWFALDRLAASLAAGGQIARQPETVLGVPIRIEADWTGPPEVRFAD